MSHACASSSFLAALHENFHLGEVGEDSRVVIVILNSLWNTFRHLMTDLQAPDFLVLEPFRGNIVVLKVLLHKAGEVSNFSSCLLFGFLQLIRQAITELQECGESVGIFTHLALISHISSSEVPCINIVLVVLVFHEFPQ